MKTVLDLKLSSSLFYIPITKIQIIHLPMSSSISLSTIQTNHILSLCKLCSNALVLVDTITFEWLRITNIIGHLFCSNNRPTIKRLNDPVKNS